MHRNDEFCDVEGSALFSVGEVPDATENLVGQPGLLENLLCIFA